MQLWTRRLVVEVNSFCFSWHACDISVCSGGCPVGSMAHTLSIFNTCSLPDPSFAFSVYPVPLANEQSACNINACLERRGSFPAIIFPSTFLLFSVIRFMLYKPFLINQTNSVSLPRNLSVDYWSQIRHFK